MYANTTPKAPAPVWRETQTLKPLRRFGAKSKPIPPAPGIVCAQPYSRGAESIKKPLALLDRI